ncbi:MAG: protein YgfX [Thiotrichales bacterium]
MPLRIPLEVSYGLIAALVIVHLAAMVALLASPFGLAFKSVLIAVIGASGIYQIGRQSGRRGRCAVSELGLSAAGEWSLRLRDGPASAVELKRAQVFRWLVIMVFQTRFGRCTVLVAADSVTPELHRRLRIAALDALRGRRT